MKTKTKIFVFIIILLLLFGETKDRFINLSLQENEAYAVAGLFSYIPNSEKEEKTEECACDKETGKIKYDGSVAVDCPCSNGECKCGCIHSKGGDTISQKHEIDYDDYIILKWEGRGCGPCVKFDRSEAPKLKKMGIKLEHIVYENRRGDFEKAGINSWPRFWIITKDRRTFTEYKFSGYKSAEYLRDKIKELDNKLNPASQTYETSERAEIPIKPFYVKQQNRIWSLNGSTNPSKSSLLHHLKTHSLHSEVSDWPLEKLSREELKWIHNDHHSGKLGPISWK